MDSQSMNYVLQLMEVVEIKETFESQHFLVLY
jgi:hypothetical protein